MKRIKIFKFRISTQMPAPVMEPSYLRLAYFVIVVFVIIRPVYVNGITKEKDFGLNARMFFPSLHINVIIK